MVAQRTVEQAPAIRTGLARLDQGDAALDETPEFGRYDHPYDRTRAGAEESPQGVTFVPLVMHPSYSPNRRVTKAMKREALIKQAAIRIMGGLEVRSLRELAEDIGCSHTAIHNAMQRFCVRLGLRPVRISENTRLKMREARRAHLLKLAP